MDLLRSCYTVDMVFRDGDAPQQVRWFRAAKEAKLFEGPQAFFSYNWEDDPTGPVGEQRPGRRPWSNGQGPACAKGIKEPFGLPEWFQRGLPPGNPLSALPSHAKVPVQCCCTLGATGRLSTDQPPEAKAFEPLCGGLLFFGGMNSVCLWRRTFILFTFPAWATPPFLVIVNAEMFKDKLGQVWSLSDSQFGYSYQVRIVKRYDDCGRWSVTINLAGVGSWGPADFTPFPTTSTIFSTTCDAPFGSPGPHFGETMGVLWDGRTFP